MSPRDKWIDLVSRTLKEIEAINRETEWTDYEPIWWVEMMKIELKLLNLQNYDQSE